MYLYYAFISFIDISFIELLEDFLISKCPDCILYLFSIRCIKPLPFNRNGLLRYISEHF